MGTIKVSQQEAGAVRRFRASADAQHIQNVLLRELHIAREEYENTEASEENRIGVNTVKRIIDVLYKDELGRLEDETSE